MSSGFVAVEHCQVESGVLLVFGAYATLVHCITRCMTRANVNEEST